MPAINFSGLLRFFCLIGFVLLPVSGCNDSRPVGKAESDVIKINNNPSLQQTDCDLDLPAAISARCFTFNTGSQDAVAQRGFELPVVILSPDNKKYPEPLLYLEGGPGTENSTRGYMLEEWVSWLQKVPIERDLVLVSTRALLPGKPHWRCQPYYDASLKTLQKNITYREEAEIIWPVLERCVTEFAGYLAKQGSDEISLASLNTTNYAKDFNGLMRALGYNRWHLMGASYGTRLAIVMAAQDSAVGKVILDSPYPLGKGSLDDVLHVWARAFGGLFERYSALELEHKFQQVSDMLAQSPETFYVSDWSGDKLIKVVLTPERLAGAIYSAMYITDMYDTIPQAISGLLEGNAKAAEWLLEVSVNLAFDREFNPLVFYATECNDNALISSLRYEAVLKQYPQWRSYFALDWDRDICRNRLFSGPKLPSSLTLKQPALIASGALDPITDKTYVAATKEQAPNHFAVEQLGVSHAEFTFNECGASLIPWFLATENVTVEQFQAAADVCNP